jgi:predicted ATP-grasp superfamily ATP-dependent carboligase
MASHPLLNWEGAIPSDLRDPVLVVALEGWIDAGYGAANAVGTLKSQIRTHRLVSFDVDELIDMRARRPMMRLVNGVNTGLRWPRLQLRIGRDRAGQDLLVLTGPEPDHRWHAFTTALMEVVEATKVRMCVGLGAFPAPAPHTRPITLGSTATTTELAQRVGFIDSTFDVPAGAMAAIERAFAEADKPAVGIWARVPHYAGAMPYPGASAAILDCLARLTGLVIDTQELHNAGVQAIAQIEGLIEGNPEHIEMVRNLEYQVDNENLKATPPAPLSDGPLPTGDELAAELEKFLREQ